VFFDPYGDALSWRGGLKSAHALFDPDVSVREAAVDAFADIGREKSALALECGWFGAAPWHEG
jgi:hypothetical protein